MKARLGTGWQYVMTDLSLILFLVTAAALDRAGPGGRAPPANSPDAAMPALAQPVAVWRAGAGPGLSHWLAATAADPRLRLTIIASADQIDAAIVLAGAAGRPARLIIEPGRGLAPHATLTFDRAEPVPPAHMERTR